MKNHQQSNTTLNKESSSNNNNNQNKKSQYYANHNNSNKNTGSTTSTTKTTATIRRDYEIQRLEQQISTSIPPRGYAPPLSQIVAFRALPISEFTLRGLEGSLYNNENQQQNQQSNKKGGKHSKKGMSNTNTSTKGKQQQQSFTTMTAIQNACIPHALAGRDILGAARTGSGKTLAFLIPLLEKLYRQRFTNGSDGVGGIVLVPTRELAVQIFNVLKQIGHYHTYTIGLLIGGQKDFYSEQNVIHQTNIIIATPGRLLQHFEQTPNFDVNQLSILILDEADRILDLGFRDQLLRILEYLPKNDYDPDHPDMERRQTLLFSATQTRDVTALATLSLHEPEYMGVHDKEKSDTPESLQQSYVVVPLEHKLNAVYSFIKTHLRCKSIIFFNTCAQVRFVYELFCAIRPGIVVLALHGKLSQERRTQIYFDYINRMENTPAVLFATDIAARGLDFPNVDWVVQVDAPEDRDMYIHRVGRTARYRSGGKGLLFVTPAEDKNGFVHTVLQGGGGSSSSSSSTGAGSDEGTTTTTTTTTSNHGDKTKGLKNNNNNKKIQKNDTTTSTDHQDDEITAIVTNKRMIPLKKLTINPNKATIVTDRAASLVAANQRLNELAKKSFKSYVRCMALMPLKHIFKVSDIEYDKFSTSLGLASTPHLKFIKNFIQQSSSSSTSDTNNNNDSSTMGREEFRQQKNVNKKLQRLKEQIKQEKLQKKLQKMNEQDSNTNNNTSDNNNNSTNKMDIDKIFQKMKQQKNKDEGSDSNDDDDDDDDNILVPKQSSNTVDEKIEDSKELSTAETKKQIKKIRIDGTNITSNKHFVFTDDGEILNKRENFLQSNFENSEKHMERLLNDKDTLRNKSNEYLEQIRQRLATTKETDTLEYKERVREKHNNKKKRKLLDDDHEEDNNNNKNGMIATLAQQDPNESDNSSDMDDQSVDSTTSSSSSSSSSESVTRATASIQRSNRKNHQDSDHDSDEDSDESGGDDDDDDDDNNKNKKTFELQKQEQLALALIRGQGV